MSMRHVLVAEDSPTQAAVLRAQLEEAGFVVAVAGNGAEALELMADRSFDLVVSDVVMPDVDGYELCQRVKDEYPTVPVVLLTSMTDPLDVVNALSAGADNFLRKPYEPAELIHRIGNMLHNKQLREAGRTQMGLELFFLGRRFMINADREQILDLLVSTFEELVAVNRRLSAREEDLAVARDQLRVRLAETEQERDRLDAVLSAMPGGMAVFDRSGRIIHANDQLAELVGVPLAELNGALASANVCFVDHQGNPVPEEARALTETLCEGYGAIRGSAFELFLERPNGIRLPVVARTEPVFGADGQVVGAVGTLEDLRTVMDHDPVTGLPGQGILLDRLESAVRLGNDHDGESAVVIVAIDRVDRFRDSLSGQGFDRLLAMVSSKLQDTLRMDDVLQRAPAASAAYLGNGEFAVVLPDIAGEDDAVLVAQHLVERLPAVFEGDGFHLPVTASAAAALCEEDTDASTLIAAAASAAREASRDGGGRVATSDHRRHEEVIDLLRREAELRAAIEQGQLVVHYQPQVAVRDERPLGVEALVRWQHPERGLLGAGEIIPLAIDAGLIASIGWSVLETACAQAAAWHDDGTWAASLSVNLAAEQLADERAPERIAEILTRTGFAADSLVLEITEGSVMRDPDAAQRRLAAIKSLGCRVAIDDFGTGYSSLLQLRRLPVDVLKIDRGFVSGMLEQPADAAIVTAVIRLARALGLEVVAEGVETEDELVQLRVLGCDAGQGFLWARPLPAADVPGWWMERAPADGLESSTTGDRFVETDEREDEVLSYLVHELRSPLSAVTGFAHLLQESGADLPEGHVEAIVRNAHELEARLASLHDVNELLRGGLTLRTDDHDVAELVRTLVSDMGPQLDPHPVSFAADGLAVASVDSNRLLQAVSNLLVNAAKFSPPGRPIDVSVRATGAVVTIEVRDHGPGVPPERRPELFRRFSRLGSMRTGMGLGLYLARLIVEAHGGVIRYRDATDGGAVFSIRLPRRSTTRPRELTSATTPAGERPSSAGGPSGPDGPTDEVIARSEVLCVDDDASITELIQRVLGEAHVEAASTVDEALEAVGDGSPDLVVLDLHIGGRSGEELLGELRTMPATAEVPIVMVTGHRDEQVRDRLLDAGAQAVLHKPFQPAQLRQTVRAALSGGRLEAGLADTGDAAPSAPSPAGPLDPTLTAQLEALGDESGRGMHQLVRRAIDSSRGHLEVLEEAVPAGASEVIAERAHAISGTLGVFGAHVVSDRCADLESVAASGDAPLLAARLDEVVAAVREAEEALVERFPPPAS